MFMKRARNEHPAEVGREVADFVLARITGQAFRGSFM